MADLSVIISTNANEVSKEIGSLSASLVKSAAKANQMSKSFAFLDDSFNRGKIDAAQYSSAIIALNKEESRLYSTLGKTTSEVNRQSAALSSVTSTASKASVAADVLSRRQRMSGKSTNKFGMIAQQVGYQVGDFNVQVQGGANALVAFGQQGTQLAGLLPGLGGAILGIGLSLVTATLRSKEQTEGLAFSFKAMKDDISKSLVTIKPLIDGLSKAVASATHFAASLGKVLVDNLDRVATYAIVAASAFAGKFVAGLVAARLATMSLSGALVVLRGALIKTGIGALIVVAGELVYQFLRLIKATGSFSAAMLMLKDVALGVWDKIKVGGDLLSANLGLIFNGIADSFTVNVAAPILLSWGRLLDKVSSNPLGKAMGFEGGNENNMGSVVADMIASQTDSFDRLSESAKVARAALDSPIKGVQELKDLLQNLDETGSNIDVSSWFGGTSGGVESGGSGGAVEDLVDKLSEAESKAQSVADTLKTSMSDAFMSMSEGTKSFTYAVKDMARSVIKQLYDILVVQKIVGSFDTASSTGSGLVGMIMGAFQAKGGAWSNGSQIKAYADGGVVGGPTTFPMAGGKTGLMGEAGPEAIMPLKRGANGKLGVQMEGNSGGAVNIVQNFSFAANGDDSVKKLIAQAAPQIANMTQKQIMDSRRRGGAMKSTFG